MWFKYSGFNAKGEKKTGSIEGGSEMDVISHLRKKGVFGVSLSPDPSDNDLDIVDVSRAPESDVSTATHEGIVKIRFNYEGLRDMLRSILLDVGVTEDILRSLIIDLKSDNVEKQRKVVEFVESMGFEREALELSKAFLFRTDFNNTENPEENKARVDE